MNVDTNSNTELNTNNNNVNINADSNLNTNNNYYYVISNFIDCKTKVCFKFKLMIIFNNYSNRNN